MALEDKVIPEDLVIAAELAKAIRAAVENDVLPCSAAFRLAEEWQIDPFVVGQAADVLEIHLGACQLGLFGYPGHAKGWNKVADLPTLPELESALLALVGVEKALPCIRLWDLAARFGISRLQVGFVADRLGIRIGPCQLGAF